MHNVPVHQCSRQGMLSNICGLHDTVEERMSMTRSKCTQQTDEGRFAEQADDRLSTSRLQTASKTTTVPRFETSVGKVRHNERPSKMRQTHTALAAVTMKAGYLGTR